MRIVAPAVPTVYGPHCSHDAVTLPEGIFCACESNRWKRIPGDEGEPVAFEDCATRAAITRALTGKDGSDAT